MSIATEVREHPVLFNAEMVRAILDGRKTETRRPMKPQPVYHENQPHWRWKPKSGPASVVGPFACAHGDFPGPYVKWLPGELMWVREAWTDYRERTNDEQLVLDVVLARQGINPRPFEEVIKDFPKATGERRFLYRSDFDSETASELGPWKPSIHMPRIASRILLEITDVRVERLDQMTDADCEAEGIWSAVERDDSCIEMAARLYGAPGRPVGVRDYFRVRWERIYGPNSWVNEPWVFVRKFKRLEHPQ